MTQKVIIIRKVMIVQHKVQIMILLVTVTIYIAVKNMIKSNYEISYNYEMKSLKYDIMIMMT